MNTTGAKIETILDNRITKELFSTSLGYTRIGLAHPFITEMVIGISFFLVSVLALLTDLSGSTIDVARLVPPAGWSFIGLINTGALKDLLPKGVFVGGFIFQNYSRIILAVTTAMAAIYGVIKSVRQTTLALPAMAEQNTAALFGQLLRTLKTSAAKVSFSTLQYRADNPVLVLLRSVGGLKQIGEVLKGEVLFWRRHQTPECCTLA
jgi:hypothetical protein